MPPADPAAKAAPHPVAEAGQRAGRADPDGSQRRQITVLVCRLAGLAGMSQALDPEETGLHFTALRKRAVDVASRFGGRLAPSSADVVQIRFGYIRVSSVSANGTDRGD